MIVATPGRLIDLMGQGLVKLDLVETFILDEADRMLDMGFINDINRVIQRLPQKRQNLMFSATMALDVAKVANKLLIRPVTVEVSPNSSTAEKIDQSVIYVEREFKRPILKEMLLEGESFKRVIVFSKTKHGASKVAEYLNKSGIPCEAFHGNKSQSARQNALNNFRNSKTRVLVATDIAARGIDIENITHVINFDIPIDPENYVHRIGRTARAGKSGQAISLCGPEERATLRRIERLIQRNIPLWGPKK